MYFELNIPFVLLSVTLFLAFLLRKNSKERKSLSREMNTRKDFASSSLFFSFRRGEILSTFFITE